MFDDVKTEFDPPEKTEIPSDALSDKLARVAAKSLYNLKVG